MILYNASVSTGIRNFARRFSNSNSTNYPDADIDASINQYYDLVVNEIIQSMDDWDFQGEVATTSLVANQQEYPLPNDIIKIKKAAITYDGTTWHELTFFDVSESSRAESRQADINQDYQQSKPYADLFDNSIWPYPVPTSSVSAGLKIWYEKNVTALSANTDEPSFHKAYHTVLSYGAAKDYLEQNLDIKGNKDRLVKAEDNYGLLINRLKEYYNTRNQDRDYIVTQRNEDWEYGNTY